MIFLECEHLLELLPDNPENITLTGYEVVPVPIIYALAEAIHHSINGITSEEHVHLEVISDNSFKLGVITGYEAIRYTLKHWATREPDTIFQIILTTYKVPFELGARFFFKFADKHAPFRERMMASSLFLRKFYIQNKKRMHIHDILENF
jgi:hypothetical protein